MTLTDRPVPPSPTTGAPLDALDAQAQAILEAAIERGRRELGTIRALPVRRTAWVHAHQDRVVIASLLEGAGRRAGIGAERRDRTDRDHVLGAWQRHLIVLERAQQGLRQIRTAIGDSPVAPDPELNGYERDLRALAQRRPASREVWDSLFDRVAAGEGLGA